MGVTGRPFDVTKIADLVFLLGLASDGPRLIATGTAGGTTPRRVPTAGPVGAFRVAPETCLVGGGVGIGGRAVLGDLITEAIEIRFRLVVRGKVVVGRGVEHLSFLFSVAALEELQIGEAPFQVLEGLRMQASPYLIGVADSEVSENDERNQEGFLEVRAQDTFTPLLDEGNEGPQLPLILGTPAVIAHLGHLGHAKTSNTRRRVVPIVVAFHVSFAFGGAIECHLREDRAVPLSLPVVRPQFVVEAHTA
jgi:hypothetical protein